VLCLVIVLVRLGRRRGWRDELGTLIGLGLAGIVVNAAVTATVSGVQSRYHTRMLWLCRCWQVAPSLKGRRIPRAANRKPTLSQSIVVIGGWSGHGIALGVRVGQLIADALVASAPLPSWGAVPDASAD
jgi:hypothetical protein